MKDTVADTVAERFVEVVSTLEAMGLRRPSILKGMEKAVEQVRQTVPEQDRV